MGKIGAEQQREFARRNSLGEWTGLARFSPERGLKTRGRVEVPLETWGRRERDGGFVKSGGG